VLSHTEEIAWLIHPASLGTRLAALVQEWLARGKGPHGTPY